MIPEWAGRVWVLLVVLSAMFWLFVFGVPSLSAPGMMQAWFGATILPPTVLVGLLVLIGWVAAAFRR